MSRFFFSQSSAHRRGLPSCTSDADSIRSPTSTASSVFSEDQSSNEAEQALLGHVSLHNRDDHDHELLTAPLFTREAYIKARTHHTFPQRGLLGSILATGPKTEAYSTDSVRDSRIYVNTNTPFSAIVCGVQGSGKSYTVAVLLENMFVYNAAQIGRLEKPLSGLVLHIGEGGPNSQPSEAAWIGSAMVNNAVVPHITVYVSPSSLNTMRSVYYTKVGTHITVEPLLFNESELDAKAFLSLMAIGSSEGAPLYMQTILSILRELGEQYTYQEFMIRLERKKQDLLPAQLTGLKQRMELLESFLEKPAYGRKQQAVPVRFAAGQLTIVDLSDPFIDSASACGFFEILTRLFVRANVNTGKVLVVDEAHKYLTANNLKGESGLTKELSSLVRQQRHQAMRVIISTQEPTMVPPALLDLCSVVILHRFSSPSWWEHVSKHVATNMTSAEAFSKVVSLQIGQSIVLAPSGLGMFVGRDGKLSLQQYGRRWLLVKTRRRVTKDGGASILVVD